MNKRKLSDAEKHLAGVSIEGNIIPLRWFQVVGTNNRYGQFKSNLLAINIMAEIVYWYRPVPVRDESTGEFSGYRSKFESDKYQFSYRHAKEKFGASKKSVKAACDLLVKLEALEREFRDIHIGGKAHNNVMFVAPIVEWLQSNLHPLPTKKVAGSPPKGKQTTTQKVDTNTETTTETTTENSAAAALWMPKVKQVKTESKTKKVKGPMDLSSIEPVLKILRESDKNADKSISLNLRNLIRNEIEMNGEEYVCNAVRGRVAQSKATGKLLYLSTFFDPDRAEWRAECARVGEAAQNAAQSPAGGYKSTLPDFSHIHYDESPIDEAAWQTLTSSKN